MEFTLKEGGRGRRKQQISEFHGLFCQKTLSPLYFFQTQGKPKKKGWGRGFTLRENPSSLEENILDTKFPWATDAQLHIALQYHDCNLHSSLFQHKMKDSLEVEKTLITGLSDTSFILQQQGPRWNDYSLHTLQFLV